MLISASIPSLVPSYFLLVAWIEVYTIQTSFLINQLWVLAGAFTEEGGRIFLDPILHLASLWAPFHSHPLQGAVWG